jgi:CRISPR system Cascade subunit CasD
MERDDDAMLARLAQASFAVRADREGSRITDYHTVGDGTFRGEPYQVDGVKKGAVLTRRDYLQDASFLAALGFEDASFAIEVYTALAAPVWPLFLGRRSCPPSLHVHVPDGLREEFPEEALRAAPYPSPTLPHGADGQPRPLRLLIECAPDHPDAQPRQDQPLSFRLSHRHFARRFVRTAWIAPDELQPLLLSTEAPCISLAVS